MSDGPAVLPRLSLEAARQVMLAAQGLAHPPPQPVTKTDVLQTIQQMGVLQIDTIHVIARSPYLVLWSRLGDYPGAWLDELLAEGALFEYWAHAMCFVPGEDYPLFRRLMLDGIANGTGVAGWGARWKREHPEIIAQVLDRLHENGAVRSADFESKGRPQGGWWNWKEEKHALEALFYTGELMIARRHNFQRLYALRQHVLPEWDDTHLPSRAAVEEALTLRAVRALGIALPGWVPDYYRRAKKGMAQRLENLAEAGRLLQTTIEGFAEPAYVHPEQASLIEGAIAGDLTAALTTLLSPFDPLVWDRQRARQLFDFDYTIECYTPAAKRHYGYFTLPILHRGQLVGRLDPKAHRAQGIFEVKALHLEPWVVPDEALAADLVSALHRLAAWHGTPNLVIRQTEPAGFLQVLQAM